MKNDCSLHRSARRSSPGRSLSLRPGGREIHERLHRPPELRRAARPSSRRASDLGYEEGALNMPISEGDRIGTTDGRVEIHLGRKNYIRLDNDTKVDILNLPKKDDDADPDPRLVRQRLSRRQLAREGERPSSSTRPTPRSTSSTRRLPGRRPREQGTPRSRSSPGLIEAAGEEGSDPGQEGPEL